MFTKKHSPAGNGCLRIGKQLGFDHGSSALDEAERAIWWGQTWDRACWAIIGLSIVYFGVHGVVWAFK